MYLSLPTADIRFQNRVHKFGNRRTNGRTNRQKLPGWPDGTHKNTNPFRRVIRRTIRRILTKRGRHIRPLCHVQHGCKKVKVTRRRRYRFGGLAEASFSTLGSSRFSTCKCERHKLVDIGPNWRFLLNCIGTIGRYHTNQSTTVPTNTPNFIEIGHRLLVQVSIDIRQTQVSK